MKIKAMMTMAAMLGSMAWAAGKPDGQKVVVCLEDTVGDSMEMARAGKIASWLFRSARVNLDLHTDRQFCQAQRDHVILISLSMHTPEDLLPGALAYALPHEGVHIRLFYDRIVKYDQMARTARCLQLRPYLLAYVVVHEITHILQGIDRHSDSGIMKAHWDYPEYALMRRGQLRFAEQDIDLIHRGLAGRAADRAPGTLVAAAGL